MDTCETQLRVLVKGGRCHFGTFPHKHPCESFRSLLGVSLLSLVPFLKPMAPLAGKLSSLRNFVYRVNCEHQSNLPSSVVVSVKQY